ncbi:nuclear pore complex protein Nup50 [Erpetoichthys calabaricus]|uniref:nuclear pore complex protein Nup50 n=1 Tax=Erpetoichthys calabaricus TaxID=27687 RepID=UPI002234B969|nr:nuclear pore complex protein Nup50 [Erpetoichthys calabaricus]
MAKRTADKELNDRNWDQEDEEEEAGVFSVASEDVIKNRTIKKAKRRSISMEPEIGGAFKNFKGFSQMCPGEKVSGFGNIPSFKGLPGLSNGSRGAFGATAASDVKTISGPLNFNGPSSSQLVTSDASSKSNGVTQSSSVPNFSQNKNTINREYNKQLAALNRCVRDWITKHVNDNPLCDLSPIFKDYEKHLASIEQKYGSNFDNTESNTSTRQSELAAAQVPVSSKAQETSTSMLFSANEQKEGITSNITAVAPGVSTANVTFQFGKKVDNSVLGTLPASKLASSFTFTTQCNTMTLFGSQATPSPSSASIVPVPKADSDNGSSEKGRCKLFYKKDNEFKEKGIGTLHLKAIADKRTQLLVRADTNLGNILLNIMLHSSIPCTRAGKNNVMIVCVPNPPLDEKTQASPVPMLIRVKTSEDADELHKIITEKKESH